MGLNRGAGTPMALWRLERQIPAQQPRKARLTQFFRVLFALIAEESRPMLSCGRF